MYTFIYDIDFYVYMISDGYDVFDRLFWTSIEFINLSDFLEEHSHFQWSNLIH